MSKKKISALILVICMVLQLMPCFIVNIQANQVSIEDVNYYLIWQRAVTKEGFNTLGQNVGTDIADSNVFTAISEAAVGTNVYSSFNQTQVFRLVAVPGEAEYFYIVSAAYGNVVTANSTGSIVLAPKMTDDSDYNQHWKRESIGEGESGAVTQGVYINIVNRATGNYISGGNPLVQNADGNGIGQQWNITLSDYEAILKGPVPDARTLASWERNAIVYPRKNELNPAGSLAIKWRNAGDDSGFNTSITSYKVYIDNKPAVTVLQTADQFLTYKYYDTKVAKHTIKIEALDSSSVVAVTEIDYFITKKGICSKTPLRVPEMGQAWYYTWGMEPRPGTEHLQFTPMQWGSGDNDGNVTNTINNAINAGHKEILGFNEPDLTAEANMPVETAVSRWNNAFVPRRGEIRLGAPVTSYPSNTYMKNFMDGIKKPDGTYPVDFLTFHQYAESPTFNQYQSELIKMHNNWPNLPIWITELGARRPQDWNWPETAPDTVSNTFDQLIPWLNAQDWIERYDWFTFSPYELGYPNNTTNYKGLRTTYDSKTGALYPLGVKFRELGNPIGYTLPPLEPVIDASDTFDIKVDISVIQGVIPPVAGKKAVSEIMETAQYTGSVTWLPEPPNGVFAPNVIYTATITLMPKSGTSYLMNTVPKDFFNVAGATSAIQPAGDGIINASFPRTAPEQTVINFISQPAAVTNAIEGNISGTLSVEAGITPGMLQVLNDNNTDKTSDATLSAKILSDEWNKSHSNSDSIDESINGAESSQMILCYQWFSNTNATNTGGKAIASETDTIFTIPTHLTVGTYYYFCEVSIPGLISVRSNVAIVKVRSADGGDNTNGSGSGSGDGNSGGGGSSSGGPSSSGGGNRDSLFTDSSLTLSGGTSTVPADQISKIVSDAVKEKNDVVVTLPIDAGSVKLDISDIRKIQNNKLELSVVKDGVMLTIPYTVLAECVPANANEVIISIAPLTTKAITDIQEILVKSNFKAEDLLKVFNLEFTVDGKKITKFNKPLLISVLNSKTNLKSSDKATGFRLNYDSSMGFLGGESNIGAGCFEFVTDSLSVYGVMINNRLKTLKLEIDSQKYTVNGVSKTLDIAPFIDRSNYTLVPLREIAEGLGAEVKWSEASRTVTMNLNNKKISFTIGFLASGMDTPSRIVNGRTMVPLRYVSEGLGANVVWDGNTRAVTIYK